MKTDTRRYLVRGMRLTPPHSPSYEIVDIEVSAYSAEDAWFQVEKPNIGTVRVLGVRPADDPVLSPEVIRELKDALIHTWEFIPGSSHSCHECTRIKAMVYELMVERSKELDGRDPFSPAAAPPQDKD